LYTAATRTPPKQITASPVSRKFTPRIPSSPRADTVQKRLFHDSPRKGNGIQKITLGEGEREIRIFLSSTFKDMNNGICKEIIQPSVTNALVRERSFGEESRSSTQEIVPRTGCCTKLCGLQVD
jgi:hypothetical protein